MRIEDFNFGDIDPKAFDKMKAQIDPLANILERAKNEMSDEVSKMHGQEIIKAQEMLRDAKSKAGNISKDIEKLRNYK